MIKSINGIFSQKSATQKIVSSDILVQTPEFLEYLDPQFNHFSKERDTFLKVLLLLVVHLHGSGKLPRCP